MTFHCVENPTVLHTIHSSVVFRTISLLHDGIKVLFHFIFSGASSMTLSLHVLELFITRSKQYLHTHSYSCFIPCKCIDLNNESRK